MKSKIDSEKHTKKSLKISGSYGYYLNLRVVPYAQGAYSNFEFFLMYCYPYVEFNACFFFRIEELMHNKRNSTEKFLKFKHILLGEKISFHNLYLTLHTYMYAF